MLDARGCNDEEQEIWTQAITRRYARDELDLGYRHSRFRVHHFSYLTDNGQLIMPPRRMIEPPEIVMTLGLRVQRQEPEALVALLSKHRKQRKQTDPFYRHAGSIFKDTPEGTAHELIQQAGLCGKRYGQAQISEQNANYIINLGEAKATDILMLIKEAHQCVLRQHGISLALNIELHGEWERE